MAEREQYPQPGNDKIYSDQENSLEEMEWKVNELRSGVNQTINMIYNDIAKECFDLDGYRLPYHGIPYPDQENPINLF